MDKENCYKGNDTKDFVQILELMLHNQLPDLKEAGYKTALSRGFKAIGEQLQSVYALALSKKES